MSNDKQELQHKLREMTLKYNETRLQRDELICRIKMIGSLVRRGCFSEVAFGKIVSGIGFRVVGGWFKTPYEHAEAGRGEEE